MNTKPGRSPTCRNQQVELFVPVAGFAKWSFLSRLPVSRSGAFCPGSRFRQPASETTGSSCRIRQVKLFAKTPKSNKKTHPSKPTHGTKQLTRRNRHMEPEKGRPTRRNQQVQRFSQNPNFDKCNVFPKTSISTSATFFPANNNFWRLRKACQLHGRASRLQGKSRPHGRIRANLAKDLAQSRRLGPKPQTWPQAAALRHHQTGRLRAIQSIPVPAGL